MISLILKIFKRFIPFAWASYAMFKYVRKKLINMADIRTILFWLIGTTCIFFGSLIAGSVEPVIGSSAASIVMAYGLSFMLIMIGGMFWISTAIMQSGKDEDDD
jgi:hypothetical protein